MRLFGLDNDKFRPEAGAARCLHAMPMWGGWTTRAMVSGLRAITPLVVSSNLPWRNPEDCELYLSVVRLAMDEAT